MNYLAHLLLSGRDRDVQVGGLLGDFVKGPLRGEWPAAIEQGIHLHRRLDSLCDRHPAFVAASGLLPPPWRRFRGVLLDVYFDHRLASRWREFHGEAPLTDYCDGFYRHLARHRAILPPAARRFCDVAPRLRWLESYAEARALPGMLDNLGRRLRRPMPLGSAVPILDAERDFLDQCLNALWPDLLAFAREYRQNIPSQGH